MIPSTRTLHRTMRIKAGEWLIHNLSKNNQSCFQHCWQGSWTWTWSSTRSGPTWCHVMCPPQCTNNCRNSQHCTINLSSHCSVLFPVFNIFSLLIRNTSVKECYQHQQRMLLEFSGQCSKAKLGFFLSQLKDDKRTAGGRDTPTFGLFSLCVNQPRGVKTAARALRPWGWLCK